MQPEAGLVWTSTRDAGRREEMLAAPRDELEWQTRRARIDRRLGQLGWTHARFDPSRPLARDARHAVAEYPTADGPADYALVVDGLVLGVVEAKRLSLAPQNVLVQARRYSRAATSNPLDFR